MKIYDRREIAAGLSRYQIVQQPKFKKQTKILNDRRGDLLLLINGMPVFHLELKRSGVDVSQAFNQIEKYAYEGLFTGIFSLLQVFVAMQPQETKYFANPGPDGKFVKDFYFHWADFNNEPINDWKEIVGNFLFIPMAHQVIGYYTVADDTDGVLKVMRSYQYFAANAISTKVSKTDWNNHNQLGGHIWHTTGSGKTMTSFKSAQLIANSKDADKVIFLMDRIELGTQSLQQYQGFADDSDSVQATENTRILISKLKSNDPANTLIVTSIQKMSNINNMQQVKMAGYVEKDGKYVNGIEDYLPTSQYERLEHQEKVVEDIVESWVTLSQNGKYHALLATSSIREAIEYYQLIKKAKPDLNITTLFDPNIDNSGGAFDKEAGLIEIMEDYNNKFAQNFTFASHDKFKKDIAARLAHKVPYTRIEKTPEQQINLLIVVDQMLTGFDSKWLNTLYLDKEIKYENIIQAFSRTNRLSGHDKPFGTIRYYRKPHTMEQHIIAAVKLYSGDKPIALFVQKLESNLNKLNIIYQEIAILFENAGVSDFHKLPDDSASRGKFAKLFKELNSYLEAAKIQGFNWSKLTYQFSNGKGKPKTIVTVAFDENTYLALALRYKELFSASNGNGGGNGDGGDVPFPIDGHLTQIDTGVIDADYMNSRFDKFLKTLTLEGIDSEQVQKSLNELHKSFATLTQAEQKYANIFLYDVQSGNISIDNAKTFKDYITDYQSIAENEAIQNIVENFGLDESKFRAMLNTGITEANIDEYGRFAQLKSTANQEKVKNYFEKLEGAIISPFKINILLDKFLRKFIISGGLEIKQ